MPEIQLDARKDLLFTDTGIEDDGDMPRVISPVQNLPTLVVKQSGVRLLRFNRYVFLHRFYLVNNESPYEVLV